MRLSYSCQSQAKCVIWTFCSCGKIRKMANHVNGEAISFGSAFEEALSEFDVPRALKSEQKETISTLVSGKDQLAVLPTGFGKNLLFRI